MATKAQIEILTTLFPKGCVVLHRLPDGNIEALKINELKDKVFDEWHANILNISALIGKRNAVEGKGKSALLEKARKAAEENGDTAASPQPVGETADGGDSP